MPLKFTILLQNLILGDHRKNGESKYMTANRCRDYVNQVPCKPGLKMILSKELTEIPSINLSVFRTSIFVDIFYTAR